MIKDPKQLESHAEYKKAAAADAKSVGAKAVRFLCFPRFPFGKETLPALLIGDVPSGVVTAAKKKGGSFIAGRMRVNGGQMDIEAATGKVDAKLLSSTLKTLGVGLPVVEAKMEATDTPPPGLKEKAPGAEYTDEDKKIGWRTQLNPALDGESDKITTKYFNPGEKEASKVNFDDKGKVVDAQGKKIKDKEVGFVMDPKNAQVHQFDPTATTRKDGKMQTTHHTSPLSGGKVAGAGLIKTNNEGRVDTIKDQSGHYKPDATLTHQVVKELGKEKDAEGFSKNLVDRSVDASGKPVNKPAKVELMGKKGLSEEEFAKVKGNVDAINALIIKKFGDKSKIALAAKDASNLKLVNLLIGQNTSVTLTTQQFEQTQGNEQAIRGKQSVNEELLSKVPKVKAEKPPAKPPASDPLRGAAKVGSDGYTVLGSDKADPKNPGKKPTAYSDGPGINSGPSKSTYATSLRDDDSESDREVGSDGYTVLKDKPGKK